MKETDNQTIAALQRELDTTRQELLLVAAEKERLINDNQLLSKVVEGTNAGYWDWNIQTGQLGINERWAAITGYSLEELEPVTIDIWTRLCHPEDMVRSNTLLQEHFSGSRPYYELELRMRHKDGRWVWVLDRGKVFEWDEQGRPLRMIGSHQDITHRKHIEERLALERQLFISGPVCVFRWQNAPGWPVDYVSPNVLQILGYRPSDLIQGKISYKDIIHPEDLSFIVEEVLLYSRQNISSFEQEYRILKADGSAVWIYDHTVIHRNEDGRITHFEGYILDYSSKKESETYLKKRLEFEHLIATISNSLINLAIAEIDPAINHILKIIGEHVRADRSYIFQFYDNNNLMDNTHEWCNEGISPEIDSLKELPTSIFPWWMENITNKKVINLADIALLPTEAAAEKEILENQGIKSIIVIPLVTESRAFGYIGFDAVEDHRDWHPETIAVLQLAGGIISNALMRKQAEKLLEAELDLALKLSASESLQETLDTCLETAIAISDMDCGGIYLLNPSDSSLELAVHKGLPETFLQHTRSYDRDSPQQQLALKGKAVYTSISSEDYPDDSLSRKEGLKALAVIPVQYKGHVIACLNIGSHRLEHCPESAQKALETISSHIGAAILQARNEEEIANAKNNLETLFNTIDDYLFIVDNNGRVILTNDIVQHNLGYREQEMSGRPVTDFHPADMQETAASNIRNMLAGTADICMVPLLKKNGRRIPVETKITRGIWNHKPVLFGISRDITERLKAEKALRESEQRFRELTEMLPQPLFECDLETQLTYANKTALEIFGYHERDLASGLNAFDLCQEKDHQRLREHRNNLLEGSGLEVREFNALKKSGQTFPAILYATPITIEQRIIGFRGVIFDLTKHKEIENERQESELKKRIIQKYRNLLDNIPGIVYTTGQNGEIDFLLSPKTRQITGYSSEEIQAMPDGWLSVMHPDDREVYRQSCRKLRFDKKAIVLTYRILTRNETQKWIEDRKSPIVCNDGVCSGTDGIIFDVSDRVLFESEKQELEMQLRQAQRLETIGTLAGGIAHDFNNILTPIMGYAELLQQIVEPDGTLREYIDEICQASERAKHLVEQILAFSRTDESNQTSVNLSTVLTEALKLLRPSIPSTIEITTTIDSKTGYVLADASQMHQVMVNLCTNAFQAMEDKGGTLSIHLQSIVPSDELIKTHPSLKTGHYVRLTVSDTGTGMSRQTTERVFEPFFTTKPVNKGTGLGLSVVHGIISRHKGTITVESTPGKGSSFSIYLPEIQSPEKHSRKIKPSTTGLQGSGFIVIVDDESANIRMMESILRDSGYHVETTTSAPDALEIIQNKHDTIDLLITDLTMPEMTGTTLARKAKRIRPALPVLLITGHGGDGDTLQSLHESGINAILRKPVNISTLLGTIQNLIKPHSKPQ